ncbi:MAG: hypothetical protein NTV51_14570 [Verrucomicrobia bacterium]|nr:hypothetical protein [Verrucomicrobiota bacterium]
MKSYDHIVPRVAEENSDFEAFYADMCQRIPALQGRGSITVPPAGFKRALKTAYLAGDADAIERLLKSDTEPTSSEPSS